MRAAHFWRKFNCPPLLDVARGSALEVSKIAINQGMKVLRTVALNKVREGGTTLEQTLVVPAAH